MRRRFSNKARNLFENPPPVKGREHKMRTLTLTRRFSQAILLCLCAMLLSGEASANFADVPPDSWCRQAVSEMEAAGLISGYADGTFRPGAGITAAQFTVMTARCAGLAPAAAASSHWAAGSMQAALEAGWYDWDELPPSGERFDQPISRKLAVKILMKALLPDVRGEYHVESRKISDFASLEGRYYEPVLAAYAAGVVYGDSAGRFRPQSGLSRGEACVLLHRALQKAGGLSASPTQPDENQAAPQPVTAVRGGVSENGWLQVKGTQLCNAEGKPAVLRGMSSHGLQWYEEYAGAQAIRNTAEWGANLFRAAMYTGEGGYLSNPGGMEKTAIAVADAAIANDMYVILDWHILSDGNPMDHVAEAEGFFTRMAARYKNSPAILYEICNEPNGAVTWERDIKPYAERIIRAIRKQSPKAVILVGGSTWSQDLHLAAQSPLEGENLMYTLHFYAGTHGTELRRRIDSALKAGLPVFVSEWGVSRADGSGGVFQKEADLWLDFLDQRGISWANWSLCDKNETSAALLPGTSPAKAWTLADLSPSGRFVFSRLRR